MSVFVCCQVFVHACVFFHLMCQCGVLQTESEIYLATKHGFFSLVLGMKG